MQIRGTDSIRHFGAFVAMASVISCLGLIFAGIGVMGPDKVLNTLSVGFFTGAGMASFGLPTGLAIFFRAIHLQRQDSKKRQNSLNINRI